MTKKILIHIMIKKEKKTETLTDMKIMKIKATKTKDRIMANIIIISMIAVIIMKYLKR